MVIPSLDITTKPEQQLEKSANRLRWMAFGGSNVLNPFMWTMVCDSLNYVQDQKAARMDEQLRLPTTSVFSCFSFFFFLFLVVQDIFIWTSVVHEQHLNTFGYQENKLHNKTRWRNRNENETSLFASIHSLYVVLIVVSELFPLQLERVCDETRLGSPRLRTKMHLHWNLKSLEFNYTLKRRTQEILFSYQNSDTKK